MFGFYIAVHTQTDTHTHALSHTHTQRPRVMSPLWPDMQLREVNVSRLMCKLTDAPLGLLVVCVKTSRRSD